MEKICGICGAKTGFLNRFRCQDGEVCKCCYRIVSGVYTTTVAKLTLAELKRRYIRNTEALESVRNEYESGS